MMYMNPGEMFLGCLGAVEQRFLCQLFKTAHEVGYTRFVEPCAGTFAMSNLAVDTGYKTSQLETSDVSMMPTILGYSIMGKPLDELEIKAKGFSDEELLDPATALYAQLYLRTAKKAGTEYFHNLLNDLSFEREKYVAQINKGLARCKARLGGMNYRPLDMLVHMREVLDDEHAIVVVNPPTYFSGYERYYDTGGLMTWKEPEYELFDPDSGHGKLFEMIADAKALVLCYQEKPAGEYIGDAIFARGETRKGMNAYICSNRGDDQSTLREIAKMISDVDDMLESFVGKDILEEPSAEFDKLISPAVQFDFKTITFAFLPYQLKNLELLVKHLEKQGAEVIGTAPHELGKQFAETLAKYQQFQDVRNLGAAVASMVEATNEKMEIAGYDPAGEWTYLTKIFGSNSVPKEAAEVIEQALKKAEKEGVVTKRNRWQFIEYLAADYLAG